MAAFKTRKRKFEESEKKWENYFDSQFLFLKIQDKKVF